MGLFSFVKDAGSKMFGDDEPVVAREETAAGAAPSIDSIRADALRKRIVQTGIAVEGLSVDVSEGTAVVGGRVLSQEDKEKIVLAVGNVNGIAAVDERLEVDSPEPEATFYTVESGDSLSKIAKAQYGDAMKYMKIFEANQPLLEDPNKIFPGQVLRIPPADTE